MLSRRTFRLYILGKLSTGEEHEFTILAEFRAGRAVERVRARRTVVASLITRIDKLRNFIEGGGSEYELDALQALGDQLFSLIFKGKIRDLFVGATGQEYGSIPCEVLVEDHALAGWPWEFLYDRTSEKFICQEFHPISRGIFSLVPGRPVGARKGTLRVLLVVGGRTGDPQIRPDEELKKILDVLERNVERGRIDFRNVPADRPDEIIRCLQTERFDVLHFIGHAGIDETVGQAYLQFDRDTAQPRRFYARDFSAVLIDQGIRLVVLNACNTARAPAKSNPANSAFATALLDRGLPAVIATQFAMPDSGADYFSSLLYGALVKAKTLVEAMADGRNAMLHAEERAYFDWGIPVLYTTDPHMVVYQPRDRADGAAGRPIDRASHGIAGREHADAVSASRPAERTAKRVAIADLDATVAFLPELVRAANEAQGYFRFDFLPTYLPAGALGGAVDQTQLRLDRLDAHLAQLPAQYGADIVLCLTRHRLTSVGDDGGLESNLMVASPSTAEKVSVISTHNLREFAAKAEVTFAKATLYLCVGALIDEFDSDGEDIYHEETVGCPLDYCATLSDVVVGLREMTFTHARCVALVKDPERLKAFRALLGVAIPEDYEAALAGLRRPRQVRRKSVEAIE